MNFNTKLQHETYSGMRLHVNVSLILILSLFIAGSVFVVEANTGTQENSPLPSAISYVNRSPGNGVFTVSFLKGGKWIEAGILEFGKSITSKNLKLTDLNTMESVCVRLTHSGETGTHIDTIMLGTHVPKSIVGTEENHALAIRKLAARDYDVIDAGNRTLTVTFDKGSASSETLVLAARIEPERIGEKPFLFPVAHKYHGIKEAARFYSYKMNSSTGKLAVDGSFKHENLGTPFFKEYSLTGSGHPSEYTYGWVKNDDTNLYVALDFVPDNTMDGDKDYAKVIVGTDTGEKEFIASVPHQEWGMPGFEYTERALYQHKIYEFVIPLKEIGITGPPSDNQLKLAFAAYGTAIPLEVLITEIRIDQPGTDIDEYFELFVDPDPGDMYYVQYLVIGDDPVGGSGVLEAAIDLIGGWIPPDWYLLVAESTFTLGPRDLTRTLNFENSDNVTHMVVSNFSGSVGMDLDTNDDGVLDIMPWDMEFDRVSIIEEENPPENTEWHYGPPVVGPDDGMAPFHVKRCFGEWVVGAADPATGDDTPGYESFCTVCLNHGDVNADLTLTSEDAQMAFLIVLGLLTPTPEEACAANCNGEGVVTAADAQSIFGAVLGLDACVDEIN